MKMKKSIDAITALAMILIAFSVLLIFFLVNFNQGPFSGFMYDEYNFIITAKNLINGYGYTSDRPLVLPVLIASVFKIFGENISLVKYIVPILASISIVSIYYFGSIFYNKNVGIISAIFISSLPIYFFLSTRILSEIPYFLFFTLSLCTFYLAMERNKKYFILVGLFTALSFLSRYTGGILFFIYLFYIFFTKRFSIFSNKFFWIGLILFFIVLLPWFALNYTTTGNLIGPLLANFMYNKNLSNVEIISLPILGFRLDLPKVIYYLVVLPLVASIFLLFSIFYFLYYRTIKRPEILLITVFFVVFISYSLLVGRASIRFLFDTSLIFVVFSSVVFLKIFGNKSKLMFIFIFIIWIFNLILGLMAFTWYSNNREMIENPNYQLYVASWEYLRNNIPRNSTILTNMPPIVADAGQNAVFIIYNEDSFRKQLTYADYVLVGRNEPDWNLITFVERENSLSPVYKIDYNVTLYKINHF